MFALTVVLFAALIILSVSTAGTLNSIEFPSIKDSEKDWKQLIFTEIYTVDATAKCEGSDLPKLTMPYPGVGMTCYGEDISFKDRELANYTKKEESMKYFLGSCEENGYGSI